MMSTSTVGMRKAFTLSRITLTLCQSHRFVRTKHSYLYSAFHSAGVTYTPTYTAVTSMQYARLLSKSFSSGFPPENDHPLQPAKPEQITTANIDDVGPTLTVDVNVPVEQLYGKIRHLHSDVVLEMLQTSYKQLDKTALAISLRRLHQVMMILPEEAREGYIEHVRTSAGFQIMCALLARNAQHFNAEVVFDMTKFLADFGLDSDHPAQLINLQLCHYHINDLAIDQLVQLATTLSKITPTDQTKTLFDGIGVLCAARETEVTILSVEEKISLLKFYGDRFGEQYQLQVLDAVKHELVDVNWKLAVPLLQAQEHLQLSDWTIMSTCINAISGGVDWLSRGDVFATLDTCFAHKLYSPDLLLAFGHKSIVECYDICEKVALLGKFRQQSFVHVSLIEDVVEFVASNTEVLDTLDGGLLLELLQCIAEAYIWVPGVPNVSEVLCQKVTDSCRLLEPTALLQVCLSLTTLKQPVSSDLVKQLFHPDNMEQLLATDAPHCTGPVDAHHITVAEKLFLVASATEASDLSEQCLRLIEEDDTRRRQSERSLPLKQAIEVSLEDNPCITEHNMTSNTGLHIDHLVRCETTPRGSPAAAGDKQELVHEKPVAVLVFDGGCFQRNTGQLKGSTHLYVRTLKREGYLMAVINWNSFQKVEERDRLRYLQHKILFASDYQDLHMMGIDNIGHTE